MSSIGLVAHAPLQIYYSALVFAPSKRLARIKFWHELLHCITFLPDVQVEWCQDELNVKADAGVDELAFSPIGRGLNTAG
jgi:hypothetical protein